MIPIRQLAVAVASRFANRRMAFAVLATAVISAKFVHICSHLEALSDRQLRSWGFSFFAQDVALLIFSRLLLEHWVPGPDNKLRFLVNALAIVTTAYNILAGIIAVTFFFTTGSEIRWRNIAVATDASSRSLILSGAVTFVITVSLQLVFSWFLQSLVYGIFGLAADFVNWPILFVLRRARRAAKPQVQYEELAQGDLEVGHKFALDDDTASESSHSSVAWSTLSFVAHMLSSALKRVGIRLSEERVELAFRSVAYLITAAVLFALVILSSLRPNEGSLKFVAWTNALLPFIDWSASAPVLRDLQSHFGTGIQREWDDVTALDKPFGLDWLPKDAALSGFEDWFKGDDHYNAAKDPMKISNLESELLPELRQTLKDAPIRHVMLVFLESTRNDVFPIKKDGLIWNRLADTWPDKKLPEEVQKLISTLTPTANYITGDYDDGFHYKNRTTEKRGGVRFTDARTTGTYTLKSMTGTLCGMGPLLADFNLDWKHHMYQPCLPQIFDAMNAVVESALEDADSDTAPANGEPAFADSKWKSYSFQTATLDYNDFDKLMAGFGFPKNQTIDREYLRSKDARHGEVTRPNLNYFGFEEDPLEEYIRDTFISAKENDERVFLTHITTTSHHPFRLPEGQKHVVAGNGVDHLSNYVNTEGYDDRWVRKILDVLDEQGVANETLVVFVGDHGLSMPENDVASPYYNPSIGIDRVPLILSHPLLPPFDVHDTVHSSQILPTILDLLLETGSLGAAGAKVATDLVGNYEGQSLIRPLIKLNEKTNQGNWQYTVINPGRGMLTVSDPRHPDWHLVVPIIDNVEWRFSNVTEDPREQKAIQAFDFTTFLSDIEKKHGQECAEWAEEGAFMTRWWVEENSRRWRYGPYSPDGWNETATDTKKKKPS